MLKEPSISARQHAKRALQDEGKKNKNRKRLERTERSTIAERAQASEGHEHEFDPVVASHQYLRRRFEAEAEVEWTESLRKDLSKTLDVMAAEYEIEKRASRAYRRLLEFQEALAETPSVNLGPAGLWLEPLLPRLEKGERLPSLGEVQELKDGTSLRSPAHRLAYEWSSMRKSYGAKTLDPSQTEHSIVWLLLERQKISISSSQSLGELTEEVDQTIRSVAENLFKSGPSSAIGKVASLLESNRKAFESETGK